MSLPTTNTILRKNPKGMMSWRNSGNLKKITQRTNSTLNSPLETCSKYWIDLEARTINRKIKLTAAVCEKISLSLFDLSKNYYALLLYCKAKNKFQVSIYFYNNVCLSHP